MRKKCKVNCPAVKKVKDTFACMEIPIWKKWLSYFKPQLLDSSSSELNPDLEVWLDRGRLQLISGVAIYSWDDLYRNFADAFTHLRIGERQISEVLLLGLGLGSVPFLLEKKHSVQANITAIELDEAVVDLAGKYALPRLKSYVEVVVADAEVFVAICEEQYDLVVMDIFEDEITPPQFETREFLEHCERLLMPGGLLLFNRMYNSAADRVATERYFKTFTSVFPTGGKIDTRGNWILFYEK